MISLSWAITSVKADEGDLTSPNAVPHHQPVGCVRDDEGSTSHPSFTVATVKKGM